MRVFRGYAGDCSTVIGGILEHARVSHACVSRASANGSRESGCAHSEPTHAAGLLQHRRGGYISWQRQCAGTLEQRACDPPLPCAMALGQFWFTASVTTRGDTAAQPVPRDAARTSRRSQSAIARSARVPFLRCKRLCISGFRCRCIVRCAARLDDPPIAPMQWDLFRYVSDLRGPFVPTCSSCTVPSLRMHGASNGQRHGRSWSRTGCCGSVRPRRLCIATAWR